ncbi:MAG: leucine-rich repeat domain-containing protein [Prevotella sp.]|nr:leucine-rich repeat domain-containing protein [Prevotella sp.]
MKHSILTIRRWVAVLAVLLSFSVGAWADEATNLTMLGKTGTKAAGQDYYTFEVDQGEARWYPNRRVLELDNVQITNPSKECFIHYSGTSQLYVYLIGSSTFKYQSGGNGVFAKSAISAGGALSIQSKDFAQRGTLTIYSYGHSSEWNNAVISVTGYSTTRARLNVQRCNLYVYRQGTESANSGYSVFAANGGSYKGVASFEDVDLRWYACKKPVLNNGLMKISRKDCIYNSKVSLDANGNLVSDDGSEVREVRLGYPLVFGEYKSYDGSYSGMSKRNTSYLATKEDYGTDSVLVYDEVEHSVTLNGGELKGQILYYGREDLVVKTRGTQLTTLEGNHDFGIKTMNSSLIIEGDHVSGHQGLKLTYSGNYTTTYGITVPQGKSLSFRRNANVQIEDYAAGLAGTEFQWVSWIGDGTYPTDMPTLSFENSALNINTKIVGIFGFSDITRNGCEPEDTWIYKNYYYDATYYPEDENEPYNIEYYYCPNAICYDSDEPTPILPLTVKRDNDFGLIVGGHYVTLDNIYDLNYSDERGEVYGVSFDEETNTLTLEDGAYIHTTGMGVSGIEYHNSAKGLDIHVKGKCDIKADDYIGIYILDPRVSIYGDGQLQSRINVFGGRCGMMVENNQTATVQNCIVNIESNQTAFSGRHDPANGVYENLAGLWVYDGASVRLNSINGPTTQYMSVLDTNHSNRILVPVNGVFDQTLHGIALNGNLATGEIIVGSNIYFNDANTESVCVANWDTNGDGGINVFEAAAVESLGEAFTGNDQIQRFNELAYFTGLHFIAPKAFYNCYDFREVTIPRTVTQLCDNSFNSTAFSQITIPANVQYIEASCFMFCPNLEEVNFEDDSQLVGLGWGAFRYCTALQYITLPKNITVLPAKVFEGCESLQGCSYEGEVTYIGDGAFQDCSNFYINIPSTVEYIGDFAFFGCYAESFSLPASVKYVGESAITAAMDLYIPEDSQLEEVGPRAFCGCYYWNLTLPATLQKIGDEAFCRGEQEDYADIIVLGRTPAEAGQNIFGLLDTDSRIYVPAGRAAAYKSAWAEYKDYIVGDDIATSIDAVRAERITGDVYSVRGQLVRRNATTDGLPAGVYIVNGKKVVVK